MVYQRIPIEKMFEDEEFVDFAELHYIKLWTIAVMVGEAVDIKCKDTLVSMRRWDIATKTFEMFSQPIAYLYQAYLVKKAEAKGVMA